jgi:hypothetical protein
MRKAGDNKEAIHTSTENMRDGKGCSTPRETR